MRNNWQEGREIQDRERDLERTLYNSLPSRMESKSNSRSNSALCYPKSRSSSCFESDANEDGTTTSPGPSEQDSEQGIPNELLAIARSSIVKGTATGSIVGNMSSVIAARELLKRLLEGDDLPDDWEEQIEVDRWPRWGRVFDGDQPICPSCHETI